MLRLLKQQLESIICAAKSIFQVGREVSQLSLDNAKVINQSNWAVYLHSEDDPDLFHASLRLVQSLQDTSYTLLGEEWDYKLE